MLEKVIEIISEFTEVKAEDMNKDTKLIADLGFNSFDVVNIVVEFEDEFDIEIPDEDIRELQTIGDIVKYIENQWNGIRMISEIWVRKIFKSIIC